MVPDVSSPSQDQGDSGAFHTTHWSIVLRAGQTDAGLAEKALEDLCQRYWYPIYCFVRRRGYLLSAAGLVALFCSATAALPQSASPGDSTAALRAEMGIVRREVRATMLTLPRLAASA